MGQAWFNATHGVTARHFPFGFVQLSVSGGLPCYGPYQMYSRPACTTACRAQGAPQLNCFGILPLPSLSAPASGALWVQAFTPA